MQKWRTTFKKKANCERTRQFALAASFRVFGKTGRTELIMQPLDKIRNCASNRTVRFPIAVTLIRSDSSNHKRNPLAWQSALRYSEWKS